MLDVLHREFVYLWYYFTLQLEQIFKYWILGMLIGSVISVFAKDKIHKLFEGMRDKKLGLFGIIPACILGILSPLCMYGTIPIAASFSEKGMRCGGGASGVFLFQRKEFFQFFRFCGTPQPRHRSQPGIAPVKEFRAEYKGNRTDVPAGCAVVCVVPAVCSGGCLCGAFWKGQ